MLRPPPQCPWLPYVWSVRILLKIGSNGRVPIGSQPLRMEHEPGAKVVRCQHWNGEVSIILAPPAQGKSLKVILHCPARISTEGLSAQKTEDLNAPPQL